MELTPEQRIHYIDPVQDLTLKPERILVTKEFARRGTSLHKVQAVRPTKVSAGGRKWYALADSGDYVDGAPVMSRNLNPYGKRYIALGEGGMFWMGTPTRDSFTDGEVVMRSVKRSDRQALPSIIADPLMRFDGVVLAAPWAVELIPLPEDSTEVARAKVHLAGVKWRDRNAKVTVMMEGMARNWDDDLETLRESHSLPTLTLGVHFSGQIGVPIRMDAQAIPNHAVESLSSLSGTPVARPEMQMTAFARIERDLNLSVTDTDGVDSVKSSVLERHLRSELNNYSLVVGERQLTPVLRSAS